MDSQTSQKAFDDLEGIERLYHLLVNNMEDVVFITDLSLNILFASRVWRDQTDFGVEDCATLGDASARITAEDQKRVHGLIKAFVESGEEVSETFEFRGRHKDGRTLWYSSLIMRSVLNDQPVLQFLSRNLTLQKRSEAAIRQSEERYRNVYNTAPLAFVVWDTESRIMDWNRCAEDLFGWKREEVLGKSFFDFIIPEEDRAQVNAVVHALMSGTLANNSINRNLTRDGRNILCEWNNSALRDEDDQIVGAISLGLDITERLKAENALRESENKYRRLFEEAYDAIFIMNGEMFVDCNQKAEEVLGRPREELIGATPWKISPPYQEGGVTSEEVGRRYIEDAYAGKRRIFQWTHLRGDGTWIHMEVSLSRLELGVDTMLLAIVRDVTERKQAEEELGQAFSEIRRLKDQLQAENIYLREELDAGSAYRDIVGESNILDLTLKQIEQVAPTDTTVLISGESGTGKELVARAIHRLSQRKDRPLIKVNCASIPSTLYESEFFGHIKGAFTGAVRTRMGRFELANKGTIFLDEVGEIPLELQSKLLRVLQEGQYERVGDEQLRETDVRIIAATNRDLMREVESGRFRQDLYYRLNVFPIQVASLRQRKEDIVPLTLHFLETMSKKLRLPVPRLTQESILRLQVYDWPGNVRELQNVLERAIITSRGGELKLDLPDASSAAGEAPLTRFTSPAEGERVFTEAEMRKRERENIIAALERANWKVFGTEGAAALLGIKPTTLASRIKKLGIEKPAHQ